MVACAGKSSALKGQLKLRWSDVDEKTKKKTQLKTKVIESTTSAVLSFNETFSLPDFQEVSFGHVVVLRLGLNMLCFASTKAG